MENNNNNNGNYNNNNNGNYNNNNNGNYNNNNNGNYNNNNNGNYNGNDNNNVVRFLLTFFLGWIGSLIINHSTLKPNGYTSRTAAYIFLTLVTFGIYGLVASISNLSFNPNKQKNIGYSRD